ncbi:MAG: AI-2E family transporter [Phycisphaerales bacterium]
MSEPDYGSESRQDTLRDLANRHIWQIQPIRDLLVIVAVLLLLWLGAKLSVVTVPLLLAMLIAYLVEPLVQRATKLSWVSRQGAAAGIIILVALAVVLPATIGGAFAARQGITAVSRLTENIIVLDDVVSNDATEEELDRLPDGFWQGLAVQLVEIREAAERTKAERERSNSAGELPPPAAPPSSSEPDPEAETTDEALPEPVIPAAEATLIYGVFEQVSDWVQSNRGLIAQRISSSGFDILRWLAGALISLFSLGFMAFLTAFFFFFICTGWGAVRRFWFNLIPERRQGAASNSSSRWTPSSPASCVGA